MRKNNARSLNMPSASWIKNVIKEEVKAQLAEREAQQTPQHTEAPVKEMDSWSDWNDWNGWDDQQSLEARPSSKANAEASEAASWNFWGDGDLLSDRIMEEDAPKKVAPKAQNQEEVTSSDEEEIHASISPVTKKPRAAARRPRRTGR